MSMPACGSIAFPRPQLQLPLAGVYCDGEIGPITQLDSQQKRCAVQGFSTILTALAGMP